MSHFETDLDEKVATELSGCTNCKKEQVKVGTVMILSFEIDSLGK